MPFRKNFIVAQNTAYSTLIIKDLLWNTELLALLDYSFDSWIFAYLPTVSLFNIQHYFFPHLFKKESLNLYSVPSILLE